ncbi:hypothetical protein E2C01_049659 [Portunus trituberculatus]|uniref:Uncharacterized protein n=1 Tax=Portunus trituberculatus TaxID=210409 RepID=A0A5B7GE93_PORTR|nr:hypothetical protein [Portunus trituberculatus]
MRQEICSSGVSDKAAPNQFVASLRYQRQSAVKQHNTAINHTVLQRNAITDNIQWNQRVLYSFYKNSMHYQLFLLPSLLPSVPPSPHLTILCLTLITFTFTLAHHLLL